MSSQKRFPSSQSWVRRFRKSVEATLASKRIASLGVLLHPGYWRRRLVDIGDKFFRFHTPSWAQSLGSAMRPPERHLQPKHYFNPIYWVIWATKFAWLWLISRPYASFGPAIPAVAVCVALGMFVFVQRFKGNSERLVRYRAVLEKALADKDYDSARIALATLTDLNPLDLTYRFQRGVLEEDQGNHEAAKDQMLRLAYGKKQGNAALWLITKEIDTNNSTDWTPEQHKKFREWVDIALQDPAGKTVLPAKSLLASYLLSIGLYEESLRYFSEIVPLEPGFAYTAATVCKQLGDTKKMESYAAEARDFYDRKLKQSPNDRITRISLARCYLLLNQEQDASQLLMTGFELSQRQDQELRIASANALVALNNRLSKDSSTPDDLLKRLHTLTSAMEIAPDSSIVIDAVIGALFECRKNQNQEVLTLRTALIKGVDVDTAHFIRGTVALLNNEFAEAKVHLELAGKFSPNMPGVLNNLAVAMTNLEESELESALTFSNAAIERIPDHPYFRETRGQILLKLGRFREAIGDLEFALRATELAGAIHPSLATAYEGLGQPDLAESHRQLATQSKTSEVRK